MLLTETWLCCQGDEAKCSDMTPPGYTLRSFPRATRGGGVAFLLRNSSGHPTALSQQQSQKLLRSSHGAVTPRKPKAARVTPRRCHSNRARSCSGHPTALSQQQSQKLLGSPHGAVTPTNQKLCKSLPGAVTPTKSKSAPITSPRYHTNKATSSSGHPTALSHQQIKSCSNHPQALSH